MATPFFGKRDDTTALRPGASGSGNVNSVNNGYGGSGNSVLSGNSGSSAGLQSGQSTGMQGASRQAADNSAASTASSGSKLTVGPNIKLKGVEITDCDTLVVEGLVEATMDSRVIQISEQGAFKGSADIDVAEIRGEFNGNLTVRQKLVIYSTGKVTGTIRYGKLVIEEGGQLAGEILFGALAVPKAAATALKPGLQAAA
ncbi:MAG: polymer-forming cytoskeletal protein [Comamonadaceae bacterium]|nr:MAG: polymer-forming cytoskeletal protein [Comamonadaceae bacterium]